MALHDATNPVSSETRLAKLEAENRQLLDEIRVARQAAEITTHLVVEQFEKTETMLARVEEAKTLAETALRENQCILDNAPVGICFTRERKIYRYNDYFGRTFGFPGTTGVGQPGRAIFQSDEAYVEIGRLAAPLLSKNLPFEHELFMRRQDGSEFWAHLVGFVADPLDASAGTIWMIQDRSTFKAAEAEIERSHREMAAIFESATHGIAFIKNREMIKANSKLEELFGYAPGELRGRTTRCWYPDDASYAAVGEAYHGLAQGLTHRCVLQMRRKDGSLFWARLSGCALSTDPQGGSVWTVENITAEYEANEAVLRAKERAEAAELRLRDSYAELEEANQRLQKLDQLKSDFLSSVSHELRTPLTSIRGFASLVEREFSRSFAALAGDDAGLGKKSRRILDNLAVILKESERLTRLINDVLDLAKIESGRVEWRDSRLRLDELAGDAANAVRGMFELKPAVALRLDLESDLPVCIGDADKLLQVLVNLLNNASKFTDDGEVVLRIFRSAERQVQIEIRDTGIGFPPEEAETIFDKFQQAQHGDTLTDRPKGTGLGLAISREIVNRHGGTIWARSCPGEGSVFAFTLPVADDNVCANEADSAGVVEPQEPAAARAAPPSGGGEQNTVLVVDDDPGIRDYLSQLLSESGYAAIAAADGRAALAAAKTHRPGLITMDLDMPVMDGYSAIISLRADPELQHIPIMVISAIPERETAGGNVVMSKPLDELRFIENIRTLLDSPEISRVPKQKLRFLVLYQDDLAPSAVPNNFSARCEVSFCPVNELTTRIAAGFEGMVAIPADLVGQIDIASLNAAPSLEVMIMPAATGGDDFSRRLLGGQ